MSVPRQDGPTRTIANTATIRAAAAGRGPKGVRAISVRVIEGAVHGIDPVNLPAAEGARQRVNEKVASTNTTQPNPAIVPGRTHVAIRFRSHPPKPVNLTPRSPSAPDAIAVAIAT